MVNRTTAAFMSLLLLLLTVVEVVYIWLARNHYVGTLSRYEVISQEDYRLKSSRTGHGYNRLYTNNFLDIIDSSITDSIEHYTIEEAIEIRKYLLNHGDVKGPRITGDPTTLLIGLKQGGQLICGELSQLYGFLLNELGFTVRHISVARSLFDPWDSHAMIEIWDNKKSKWILSDPTFNISFKHNGKYLSSDEVYNLIHSGNSHSIRIIHGEKTKYEYPLEQYYISYFSLFDNVFYYSYIGLPGISKYPPLRYFDERRVVKLLSTDKYPVRGNEVHIQNAMMLFILMINPLFIVILFIVLVACINYKIRFIRLMRS